MKATVEKVYIGPSFFELLILMLIGLHIAGYEIPLPVEPATLMKIAVTALIVICIAVFTYQVAK